MRSKQIHHIPLAHTGSTSEQIGSVGQALHQDNLIDQYNLLVYPIVVGSGQRLFGDSSSASLKLTETKAFSSGVVLLVYQPETT